MKDNITVCSGALFYALVVYTTNLNTSKQYKYENDEWLLAYDGEYQNGTWRLAF